MDNVVIENTGSGVMHVAGQMIPPGEMRIFAASQVPPHMRPQEVPAEPLAPSEAEVLAQMLGHSVPQVTELLPSLAADDLNRLEVAELAGKARKSLLEAVGAERLRRAAEPDADPDMTAFTELLAGMDDGELAAQIDLHAGNQTLTAAVGAEIEARTRRSAS